MTKLEDGKVYEFIENLYGELKEKDGGYYPSKHDSEVFEKTYDKFNMSTEEIDKIFNDFQEVVAQKKIQKLSKLPNNIREERRMEILKDILKNNKDSPFSYIEGPPSEPIRSGLDIINEEYKELANNIGENGWTIPMAMGLNELEKLAKLEKNIEVYDDFYRKYYNTKKFNLMVKHINASSIGETQKQLFNDCVDAYKNKKYLLCVTSLTTILEGVLSSLSDDKADTRMIKICRYNMDLTKDNRKLIKHLIWISFFSFISTLYKKSDFKKDEPISINRHWIVHGRTETDWKGEDCLRLFNAIYTITSILNY